MNNKYLFDENMKNQSSLFSQQIDNIVGVDEVGRGSIAGPVVVASVYIKEYSNIFDEIDDSKKLTPKKRDEIYDILINSDKLIYSISIRNEKTIDDINILNATLEAMNESTSRLIRDNKLENTLTLVDGNTLIKGYKYNQQTVIKGDSHSLAIATASIIAKVYRDRLMNEYSIKYTQYDFSNNKGYGTKKHYEAIEKYGITPIHRKTFLTKFYEREINEKNTKSLY